MSGGPAAIFRARMLRAVADVSPGEAYVVADTAALDRLCECLVEAEEAKSILRNRGYGKPGMTLPEVAATVGLAKKRKP